MADFESIMRPHLEEALDPGESLEGICAGAQQSTFKGRSVALGVTDRRLLLAPLDRRGRPEGDLISIRPEDIESAKAGGAGGGWVNVAPAILDSAAVTLQLKTTSGEKYKLSMMRGTGVLGKLGGGEAQREGLEALARWFARFAANR
jgi:hypothetical protein